MIAHSYWALTAIRDCTVALTAKWTGSAYMWFVHVNTYICVCIDNSRVLAAFFQSFHSLSAGCYIWNFAEARTSVSQFVASYFFLCFYSIILLKQQQQTINTQNIVWYICDCVVVVVVVHICVRFVYTYIHINVLNYCFVSVELQPQIRKSTLSHHFGEMNTISVIPEHHTKTVEQKKNQQK